MVPSSAYNKTAEEEAVQGHPSGCGCVAAGLDGKSGPLALSGVVLGLAALGASTRRRARRDR
jgi:hypothetical protein